MKKLNILVILFSSLLFFAGCEEEYSLGEITTPSNLSVSFELVGQDEANPFGDGTGFVNFTATAENEINYTYIFGDGTNNEVSADGNMMHRFSLPGVNTYNVTVLAVGTGGVTTSKSIQVEVFSSFSDEEAIAFLTGGSSKKWYWAADQPAHTGLGPNFVDGTNHTFAQWYAAAPFEKTCMYDAEFVFTQTDGGVSFEQTAGSAFIPGTYAGKIGVEGDVCHGEDVLPSLYGVKNVTFAPANSIATEDGGYRGTSFTISDDGFMCWYAGTSTYEIIEITDNILRVRVEEDDTFAWYHIFTSTKPSESAGEIDVEYTNLVWSDEFDTDGAPDAVKWDYDLGAGGWGNNESQTYTNDAANVSISNGILKITAKADGGSYTSARLKTQDKFEFTYGRVDVRAKLPTGGGTWPAIWMLGANFPDAGWPACGEIDIMEGMGNNPGHIQCALHTPSSSGATENMESTTVADASEEFHVYSVNWSENQITFLIDDEVYYTYAPEDKNADNWPYNADQFLIMNVAMGGSLGGTIDPAFVESSMEIDYVRVYQ
ncbi:family 16 glycosylhydrolase [Marinifilum fragile]|uniref:family 16 glycosylhydrolase n=1 Tax=Marinifilum fragile TaxID=570161 RepID=UPI002AAC2B6B|nr:family 16 glycosylhydrolase [Marinifilum fragile]